jgi:3-oxoisoapionate decarboxylase
MNLHTSGSPSIMNRRSFLGSLTAMGMAGAVGSANTRADAPARNKLRLGIDNFSIRDLRWKAPQLIEYAAAQEVSLLLLSDLDVYESLESDYLKRVRAQADAAGVQLHVGTGSICPTSSSYNAQRWGPAVDHARLLLRTAATLGSPVARCYLGSRRDREGDGGIYRHIEETVKVLRAVRGEAENAGIKFAVENHAGDMQAWELVELIEAAGTGHVGATMDPGNSVWTIEDPMVTLELLGPYTVTTGIRDSMVWEIPDGAEAMWTNMGQGQTDWPAYIQRFQELCPTDVFILEIISYRWGHRMPYLQPAFWDQFPRARASEFARFVALAKRGKKPEPPPGRPSGPDSAQQRFDLEESLRYCRDTLGL